MLNTSLDVSLFRTYHIRHTQVFEMHRKTARHRLSPLVERQTNKECQKKRGTPQQYPLQNNNLTDAESSKQRRLGLSAQMCPRQTATKVSSLAVCPTAHPVQNSGNHT